MRNWSENQITFVLIRHGVTKSNREQRYLGKTEESLSEDGVKDLLEYKNKNRYPNVEYVFTSPMKRCVETAEILYPNVKNIVIPEWEEMDFGAFEGKNYMELKDDRRYQLWIDSNGTLPFPEGESREEFILRCERGFYKMIKELCQLIEKDGSQPKTIGMIVHGGTIMALLSLYYGGEYFDYQVSNGGGYVCTLKKWSGKTEMTELKKI